MTSEKRYLVNEIFYSLQGEGRRSGEPSVFVRLAKCNMRCRLEEGPLSPGGFDCDTEFESGRRMTATEILDEALRVWPMDHGGSQSVPTGEPWIVLTGGEPALQADEELLTTLRGDPRDSIRYFNVAVETNGSILLPHTGDLEHEDLQTMQTESVLRSCFPLLDWITVSPKVAEHAVRQRWAHEVKYVRGYGQAAPRTAVRALHRYLSPAYRGLERQEDAEAWVARLCLEDPTWSMTTQSHKDRGLR